MASTRTTPTEGETQSGTKIRVSLNTSTIDERKIRKSDLTRLDSEYAGEGFTLTQERPSAELTVSDAILSELKTEHGLLVEPIE